MDKKYQNPLKTPILITQSQSNHFGGFEKYQDSILQPFLHSKKQ